MLPISLGFPDSSAVKNSPARQEQQKLQEMRVWSLGQEDPLEEGMATHSSILAWESPWTEERGRLQSKGSQRVGHAWNDLAPISFLFLIHSCFPLTFLSIHPSIIIVFSLYNKYILAIYLGHDIGDPEAN